MKTVKRILSTGAILGLAVSLGACSSASNPGTAVESLGVTYTESDITVATDQLSDVLGQALSRQDVVFLLAAAQPYFEVASELGIDRDSAEVTQMLAMLVAETGGELESLDQSTLDALATIVVAQTMTTVPVDESAVDTLETLAQAPATVVNPRYGEYDLEQGFVPTGVLADVVELTTPEI